MTSKSIYPITEAAIARFKPTWLYVKQHTNTGLKYFGKTISKNPYKYLGSGTHWQKHLKVHGKHVETIWCQLFTDIYECVDFALKFSRENDIVKSKEWANLRPENGVEGGDASNFSRNTSPTLNAEKAARTLKSNPERLAARNAKVGIKQKETIKNKPEMHAAKMEMMTAPIRGATKETSPRIRKQIKTRRENHVSKMNSIMAAIAASDLTGLTQKKAAEQFGISLSTFQRMRHKLKNGQLTWE